MKRFFLRIFVAAALATALIAAPAADNTKAGTAKKGASTPVANQCIAKTADGDQCKRKAQAGKQYCWQHDPTRKSKSGAKKS
ncbi:MAG: hypothetical protein IT168_02225 [Bryobacterales bacterium]|nr:hypothetical protein [Bryobacterales bacterium]